MDVFIEGVVNFNCGMSINDLFFAYTRVDGVYFEGSGVTRASAVHELFTDLNSAGVVLNMDNVVIITK